MVVKVLQVQVTPLLFVEFAVVPRHAAFSCPWFGSELGWRPSLHEHKGQCMYIRHAHKTDRRTGPSGLGGNSKSGQGPSATFSSFVSQDFGSLAWMILIMRSLSALASAAFSSFASRVLFSSAWMILMM